PTSRPSWSTRAPPTRRSRACAPASSTPSGAGSTRPRRRSSRRSPRARRRPRRTRRSATSTRARTTSPARSRPTARPSRSTAAALYFREAKALEALGQAGDALNAYREAVSVNRNLVAAWERIADIHEGAGRKDDAAAALAELIRVKPDEPSWKLRLARIRID